MSDLDLLRKELAQVKSRLNLMIEGSLDAIISMNEDGAIVGWNTQAHQMFGWSAADVLGKPLESLIIPPELRRPHRDWIQRFLETGEHSLLNRRIELEALRRDQSRFPIELSVLPCKNSDGFEFVAMVRDITEQKSLENDQKRLHDELESLVAQRTAELTATRDRLELALRGGNVGLWDWNAETNDVYYSESYKVQLGYPADLPWCHFDDWKNGLHPDDREMALQRVNDYFAEQGDEYESTFRLRCSDGSYRWFLARGKAAFDSDGRPLRMLGVHIDITQQRSDQKELERLNEALTSANRSFAAANDALEASNVELQQFAYVASHDLQTPLRAIAGFAQFLKDDYHGKIDDTADDYIGRIVTGAKRMQKMIDDLLAFSRVESRAAPFQPVDMNEVFRDATGLLGASIEDCNATVTRDHLPTITGDQAQLVQLLQNLIGNALKYCEVQPIIHVSAESVIAEPSGTRWVFQIKDNGIGIEEKQHKRIFEVFQRLHSKEAYPGTGIGLAVCRRIVGRHHGEIWVESTPGEGSTFFVAIPATLGEAPT